jgi:hypothetical protein
MFLFCISCVDDKFDSNIAATEDVIIANEMEITLKAIGIIHKEVEAISAKIEIGQAIGVSINEENNGWEYTFNTDLLSGKVVVETPEQNTNSNKMKIVDCSKLKIHYYDDIWLRLFGSFITENIAATQINTKHNITVSDFGHNNVNSAMIPDVTINFDNVVTYDFASSQIIFSGSGNGHNQSSGNYSQSITESIKIVVSSFKIVDGKITIVLDKSGERFPIEIEYSELGRTVKYKGNTQTTYYNN